MDKLLQWSIAQQSGDKEAMAKIGQPDPKMLLQLFGAPDEPALMKQAIVVASNPEATEEDKEVALENFEMLIENLDNANNIENLQLWPAVIAQLLSSSSTRQVLAASIIGIATQNNPPSQEAFIKHEGGLQKLIELASADVPKELVMKSVFALACVLRHCPAACELFATLDGWKSLALTSHTDHKLLMRKLSLISAVISTGLEPWLEHFHSDKIVEKLIATLSPTSHVGCMDKTLNILAQLHSMGFKFSQSEVSQLDASLKQLEPLKDELSHEDLAAAKQVAAECT